jgi:hypothetical protein
MRKALIKSLHVYQKWRMGDRIKALHPKDVGLVPDDCARILRKLIDEQVNEIFNEKKND